MNDRFYGVFDPVTQSTDHIAPCAQCSCPNTQCIYDLPQTTQLPGLSNKDVVQLQRRAYFVRCPQCDSVGLAAKKQWQAVIEWNKSPKAAKQSLNQFPLFGISHLDKLAAKHRLNDIRCDLEQRKKSHQLNARQMHNNHYEKIRAFLAWSIYAQTVVKLSPNNEGKN